MAMRVRQYGLRYSIWLIPLLAFAVYAYTLTPAVGLIDSGELAAGCWHLNILHPTGYPLYSLLGRLATFLPLGSVVTRMALFSAALAATATALLLLLLLRLGCSRPAAGVTALLFAFSFPLWSVAVDVEVYALTAVLTLLLWLTVVETKGQSGGGRESVFAYLCGLTLTNHMSGISAVFGAGIAFLGQKGRFFLRQGLALIAFFSLGLSPYVFLVLRAKAGPLLAWGNPVNLERLFWHITGRQYQVWMFSLPFSEVLGNMARGGLLLAKSFLFLLIPVVLYGVYRLLSQQRWLGIGLLFSAVLTFLYAANYSIPDIEAYYLPCLIALLVFCGVGLESLCKWLSKWRYLIWMLGAVALGMNLPAASRRGFYVSYDQAMNTLTSAQQNATILTDWWDIYSPIFYLQHVEGVRPDVCIIDKELVRRSWYFKYLERVYPWLVERSQPEISVYLQYLEQFEHGRLKDVAGIQRAYIRLLESFVRNSPERYAYVTFGRTSSEDAKQMFADRSWIPTGLLYELRDDSIIPPFDFSRFTVRIPRWLDQRTRVNLARYRRFCEERISLLQSQGRWEEAQAIEKWFQNNFGSSR